METSLPLLRPKKVEVRADPLKKLVEKSKEDFFGRRESQSRLRSSSRRRQQPLIKQFESEVERILRSDHKPSMMQSRISSKLQELLGEDQPNLASNLRQIEQYNLEKSRTLKKSRLVQINVDLAKLSASRYTSERPNLPVINEVRAFKLPLLPPDELPKTNFSTYHTREGDVQMACETVEQKEDKIRIRFVNGFQKWIRKPVMPHTIAEDVATELQTSISTEPKQTIVISERLLKPILSKVREAIKVEYHSYIEQQLRRNYTMSMSYFQTLYQNGRLYELALKRPKEITLRSGGYRQRRNQLQRILFGSEDLNFVKEFTLEKTKYFPHIIDCYVSLKRILEFPHFRGFIDSFKDSIGPTAISEKIQQYFFQKKQQFEMLLYEVETTVTLLVAEVRDDIQTKISVNSRLEALTYKDRLTTLLKNITIRMNLLLKSHALQGVIDALKQLAQFYHQEWASSIIVNLSLPRCKVYEWCCELPHPLKYKPLIELKLQYRRLKKIKKKNMYKYLLELRRNIRQARCYEQARVYCRPLEQLEQQFDGKFSRYLQELTSMENVNGCTNYTIVGFDLTDDNIVRYRKDIRSKIGRSYDRVTTICGVLSNFQLYLTDKSYIDELLELFQKINGCELARDELNYLKQDRTIVSGLPNSIYCDLLVVQTSDLKQKILSVIDSNRSKIIKACEHKLSNIYERSHQRLLAVQSRIESAYGNLDLFLNFYEFFKERNIQSSTNLVVGEMLTISTLYDILVEVCAKIPPEATKHYLSCQDWLRRMQNARTEAKRKLAAASELFVSTIKQTKLKIVTRLQKMIKQLLEVGKLTQPTNYRKNSAMCKGIFEELRELSETADGILQKQTIFNLPLSDFTVFHKEKQQFEKYVKLWDFIEKLKDKEAIKKLTVANFSSQDLLLLSREGLEVVHFVKRNTVNKRFLTLTDEVQKELSKLLDKLPLLVLVLNPSFSQTQWLGLFKEVFPQQDKFPSFYEMSVYDFEKTGILEHPKEIYQHYRVVRSEYGLLSHLNFFEFALKHLDFGYCLIEDMEVLVVSDETMGTVARLCEHFTYLLTVYYKNGKVQGMVAFLRSIFKALQQIQSIVRLLPELNCILKWYTSNYRKEEYPILRDALTLVADEVMKKTETIKKFTLFYLYEDRSKVTFTDALKSLQQVRLAILDGLEPLKQRYQFLRWLDNTQIYDMLSATDNFQSIDIQLRRHLLKEVQHLSLSINDAEVKLRTVATYYDEQIQFEKSFFKVRTPQDGIVSMAVFDIYQEVRKQLPRVIRSETLTALCKLHCHQLDVAVLYEYYSTSHAPLQSVLLAMLLQFNMTLLCICESRSDIKDYHDWIAERLQAKNIPQEPIRKAALDAILELMEYFVEVLAYMEANCGPRATNYAFISLPKMLPFRKKEASLSKELSVQQTKWTSAVKASLEQDTSLFSRVTESPIYKYMGISLLDKYTHESQLGSEQIKMLKLDSLVNYGDLSFGLESCGLTMQYGCQLAPIRIPKLSDHETLSNTVVCVSSHKILLSSIPMNQFMLGRAYFELDSKTFIHPESSITKMFQSNELFIKVRMDRLDSIALVKITSLEEKLHAFLAIECTDIKTNQLMNLPSEVVACFRVIPKIEINLPQLPTLERCWETKGLSNIQTLRPLNDQTERIRNSLADALRQYYMETGVAWHNGLELQCLTQPIFAADTLQSIRALANIHSISRFKAFNVIYVPLYEYSNQQLLGRYRKENYEKRSLQRKKVDIVSQVVWEKGILERLFDDIERYLTTEQTDMHYLSTYYCQLMGKQTQKERNQTLQDWFVFDLSLWQPNNTQYLQLADWIIGCARGGTFTFQSGRSYRVRLENFKLVLKLPSSQHLPVSAISIPCAFSPKSPEIINIDRQMALWKHQITALNGQLTVYSAQIAQLTELIFTEIRPLLANGYSDYSNSSGLTFQQQFSTYLKMLSIGINQLRKFFIAQGFYNYTDLTDEEKKNIVSPVDLRSVSTIKDDIQQLHEISRQQKDLDACRRALFKDLGTFMNTNLKPEVEEVKAPSKRQSRILYCLQSIATFSFYWSFCGLVRSDYTAFEGDLLRRVVAALERHSKHHRTDQYAFNLKQLVGVHADGINLRRFVYNLQRESWLTWREIALPNLEAVSASFTDRILDPLELVRLSPHAASIDYISGAIDHLSEGNTHFITTGNSYSSAGTEYLTKIFLAYSMPLQLIADKSQQRDNFTSFMKQHILSYNLNRMASLTSSNMSGSDIVEYLNSKCRPSLGNRFMKYKGRNQLNTKLHRLFVFVQDISLTEQNQQSPSIPAVVKSLPSYQRIRNTPINNFSLLLIGSHIFPSEELSYVRYEDTEPASLLSIYYTVSEGFKPNNVELFNFFSCNEKSRSVMDSLKLYPILKTELHAGLVHINRSINHTDMLKTIKESELRKIVQQKVKQEIDYYRFLKGQAAKNFGKEEKPFEEERLDRERELLVMESQIDVLHQSEQPEYERTLQQKILVPKYLIDPRPEESPRREAGQPSKKPKTYYNEFVMVEDLQQLGWLSQTITMYLKVQYTSNRQRYRILQHQQEDILKDVLYVLGSLEVYGVQRQYLLVSEGDEQYCQFVFRMAMMLKEKASEASSAGRKVFKLSPTEEDITHTNIVREKVGDDPKKWQELSERLLQHIFLTLHKDSFSKHILVVLELAQHCNDFLQYFERCLNDSRLLDKLVPAALVDRNQLASKYKGFENIYKAHMVARMKEKCYICYVAERDWLQQTDRQGLVEFKFPLRGSILKRNISSAVGLDADSTIFSAAYTIYRKYYRKQFITYDHQYRRLLSLDQAQHLFSKLTEQLLQLMLSRENELITSGGFLHDLQYQFSKKTTTLEEAISTTKLDLNVKRQSLVELEQESKRCRTSITSSQLSLTNLKESLEQSEFIRYNSQRQKMGYDGQQYYFAARQQFRQLNRKQLEKEVARDEFYSCSLILFYVYWCNILTDNNFFNEKYSELLEGQIEATVNEQMKKQFMKAVGYGRLFIVVDSEWMDKLSPEQLNMARKLRKRFGQLLAIDEQAKQRNKGRVYSHDNKYQLKDQISPEIGLLKYQKMNEMQLGFAMFMACCFDYKRDMLKMDTRIAEHKKNMEQSTERLRLVRESAKQAKQQLDRLEDRTKQLRNKIVELEHQLQVTVDNSKLLKEVHQQNLEALKPVFLFESTYVYGEQTTRKYQALLLSFMVVLTVSGWSEFMTDEMFQLLRTHLPASEQSRIQLAINWMEGKMFIKLLTQQQLRQLLQTNGIYNQRCFWNMVFCQLLRNCGFDNVDYDSSNGIRCDNQWIRMVSEAPTPSELLLDSFENKVSGMFSLVVDHMQQWTISNSRKYLQIIDKIQSAGLKHQSIEGLRVGSFEPGKPPFAQLLEIDIRPLLKKYEQMEKVFKQFDSRHLSQLIDYTVQICRNNFIGQGSPTFQNDFMQIFNQVYYEFSSLKNYQQTVLGRWLGDIGQPPNQPTSIFVTLKRRDQHKKIVSDYDRLNETARKYEVEVEERQGSMSSLEVSLLSSSSALYKRTFHKRFEFLKQAIQENNQVLNIHEFVKKPDCQIVRLKQSQVDVVCDSTRTSEVMSNNWFEGLVKSALGRTQQPQPLSDRTAIPSIEKFFPSEIIKLSMQAHRWTLINDRSGLQTALRLHTPIVCIASNGENNLLEVVRIRLANDTVSIVLVDFNGELEFYKQQLLELAGSQVLVVRCINIGTYSFSRLLEQLLSELKTQCTLKIVFLLYCEQQHLQAMHLPLPAYYIKAPTNIKSQLIKLNHKVYSTCISDVEVEQGSSNVRQHCLVQSVPEVRSFWAGPSLFWLDSNRSCKYLRLKLQMFYLLFKLRCQALGDYRQAVWMLYVQLQFILQTIQSTRVDLTQLICSLLAQPDLEPVISELSELVNFGVDNIIYELSDPQQTLINVLPGYDNFLGMIAMLPDADHRDMLLLTEMPRINARSRQSSGVLCDYRFQSRMKQLTQQLSQFRKNAPIQKAFYQIQTLTVVDSQQIKELKQTQGKLKEFFQGLVRNSFKVELHEDNPHNFKLRGDSMRSKLNINELTRKEAQVEALNQPESYYILFKLMKFVKKILKKRANSGSLISAVHPNNRMMKANVLIDLRELFGWVVVNECQTIIERKIFSESMSIKTGGQLKQRKKLAQKGEYIRELYQQYIQGKSIDQLDCSKLFNPQMAFAKLLWSRAFQVRKHPSDYRIVASFKPSENRETLPVAGLSIRYGRVDPSEMLLIRSDEEYNPIGLLYLSIVQRQQPTQQFVMVLSTSNLEQEYRASQTKDKKGGSKILASERRVTWIPFRIGAFRGCLYIETKLQLNYTEFNDVRLCCQ